VDPAVLYHLGMAFVPVVTAFSAIAIAVLLFYDIDRSKHLQNIRRLETTAGADPDSPNAVLREDGERAVASNRGS